MKNMKIGKKLLLTFALIIILFLITTIVAILGLRYSANSFKKFYSVSYPVSEITIEMRRVIQAAAKDTSFVVLESDPMKTADYVSKADDEVGSLKKQFEFLEKHYEGDLAPIEKAKSMINDSESYRKQITALSAQGENEQASKILLEQYHPILEQAQDVMKQLDDSTGKLAESNYKDSMEVKTTIMIVLVVIAILALAATVILSLYITGGLARPIKEIEAAVTRMVDGKLEVAITYESQDELGRLAADVRTMAESQKALIYDVDYLLHEMADGNFNVVSSMRSKYVGDFKPLLESLRKIKSSLSGTLLQINQAADQVASGSDQVSSGAQALSQGTTEQASSIEELSASINEISEQVKYNAANALDASKKAMSTGAQMKESNQQMQDMIHAMSEISDSSNEISKIIKTIEDIAFQTNILALNAAVEAARAGSAGKGFAVVADEVRNLASKSADASKNTAMLIEGSLRAVQNGTKIADQTAKFLTEAAEGTMVLTKTIDKISEASSQQANAISQVTQGMDQIASVVQTNSATAEESAAASEELSSQAQMLKNLVGKFRLQDVGSGRSHQATPADGKPKYKTTAEYTGTAEHYPAHGQYSSHEQHSTRGQYSSHEQHSAHGQHATPTHHSAPEHLNAPNIYGGGDKY